MDPQEAIDAAIREQERQRKRDQHRRESDKRTGYKPPREYDRDLDYGE